MKRVRVLSLIVSGLVLGACGSTSSDNIKTKGIYADYDLIVGSQGTTQVMASLHSGGSLGAYLDLVEGDSLVVEVDGESESLERYKLSDIISYQRTIQTNQYNKEVAITFNRQEDNEVLISTVKLPSQLEIISPTQNTTLLTNERLNIAWNSPSESDSKIDISIYTKCYDSDNESKYFSGSFNELNDDGNYSIELDPIYPSNYAEYSNCQTTLKLTRHRQGSDDSQFDGGTIVAKHTQTIDLIVETN